MNAPIDITNVTLQTPRLILRPWRATDLSDFYEYSRVDGVGQMAGWLPPSSIEAAKKTLDYFIAEKSCFALELGAKVIGSLGVDEYNEAHYSELAALRGREIGYVLSRDYWGQGLMPEAVQAVIRYLFDTVQLDFLIVGHFDWNTQSRRVIEKCGFAYNKTVELTTSYGKAERSVEYMMRR